MANDKKAKETTIPVSDAVKLEEGGNTISGPPPGSSVKNVEMSFEDLGDLMTFNPVKDDGEGTGEFVTVLSDYLTGADGHPLFKGSVIRLSKCVTNYAKDDATRGAVLRLINVEAIRKATRQEIMAGSANITMMSESPEVREERALRMAAEAKLEMLQKQLENGGKIDPATLPTAPETAPADEGGATIADEDWK